MDEVLSKALQDELLAMIAADEVGPAIRKLEAATGMDHMECSAWVKDRIPFEKWNPLQD